MVRDARETPFPVDPPPPWESQAQREVYHNPWSTVIEEDLRGPQGQTGLYGYFAAVDCVVVVPTEHRPDGQHWVHLVRQWRHPIRQHTWECPCGRLEPGENIAVAAARELAEECGLSAGQWQELGSWVHSDARVAGRITCLWAQDLTPLASPQAKDASEVDVMSQAIPFPAALDAIASGALQQVATIAALLRLNQLLQHPPH